MSWCSRLLLVLGLAVLAGCPKPVVVEQRRADTDRCPGKAASWGLSTQDWFVATGSGGWVVCRNSRIRYRAAPGALPPRAIVATDGGSELALVEQRGDRCALIVLQRGHGDRIDPLRFPVPGCEPSWRPHWVDDSTVTVGP